MPNPAVVERPGPVGPTARGVVGTLPRSAVRLGDGLLATLQRRNADVTMPHGIAELDAWGNLENLRRLTGESTAAFRGYPFADSDVYKTLEAVAWELGRGEVPTLRSFYDEAVALLERAQRDDGYLDSAFQLDDGRGAPWSDFVHGHELYCLGHLIQAAVAGKRAIDDDRLLGVALRWVELVHERFGGPDSPVVCGHPEVETALVELYRLTGDERHLVLAQRFVDRRGRGFVGRGMFGPQYYQDDATVRETRIMRGHAVRALYLNAGATDVALETGDASLLDAMRTQWADLVAHRLYITGGTGARHRDEAFGDAYELPSERAYAETCAGIALMGWAWRIYLATGEASFVDTFEQCLYNVVASGVSQDGTHFSYANPLQRRADHGVSQEESAGTRLEWFTCACCPPNLMRTLASIEAYLVTTSSGEVQVAAYADADVDLAAVGIPVTLAVRTRYPADGRVEIRVGGDGSDRMLALRVPSMVVVTGGARRRPCGRGGTRRRLATAARCVGGWNHDRTRPVPGAGAVGAAPARGRAARNRGRGERADRLLR